MNSLIFKTASHFLLWITLIFSIWVLFRGHNAPGGGFIGGLIAASGFALYLLAFGAKALRQLLFLQLMTWLAIGFSFALFSSLIAVFKQKVFFTSVWFRLPWIHLQLGSPILFDIGVYIVVLSSVLLMMLTLERSP